jgi:hypothetical protein
LVNAFSTQIDQSDSLKFVLKNRSESEVQRLQILKAGNSGHSFSKDQYNYFKSFQGMTMHDLLSSKEFHTQALRNIDHHIEFSDVANPDFIIQRDIKTIFDEIEQQNYTLARHVSDSSSRQTSDAESSVSSGSEQASAGGGAGGGIAGYFGFASKK